VDLLLLWHPWLYLVHPLDMALLRLPGQAPANITGMEFLTFIEENSYFFHKKILIFSKAFSLKLNFSFIDITHVCKCVHPIARQSAEVME
jgi:hypothetical protein